MQSSTINFAKEIRKRIASAILKSGASHIASAMSIVDIVAVLYGRDFVAPEAKQFFLSKGHSGIAVYSTLNALGVISDEMFATYYQNGSSLGGHISHKNVPGVHLSTGSLGGGIAVANGVLLANRINNINDRAFVIVGDGECQEGSIWESVLFAATYNLSNLVVFIDRNKLQGCGKTEDILKLDNLEDKFKSFGWNAIEINGHDHSAIENTLLAENNIKPLCIIANTTKGKGVSFMENNNLWHYKNLDNNSYDEFIKELDKTEDE